MSYVPSDFDSLNEGLNILNIVENSTDLAPYEGIYEDKGIGVVQQYSLHGNLFAWTDPSNLSIDFCYILKGGHPETYPALPSDRDNPVSLRLEHYITGQSTPVAYYELLNESYTVTQDSNGNKVLLFENITLNDKMPILTHFTENEAFAIAFKDSYMAYIQDIGYTQQEIFTDLCSYNRSGVNNTPDTQQPIYLKWVNESTVNFSAQKVGGLDGKILTTFSGTFDNSFMGDMFNDIAQISVLYTNPHTLEDIYYTLEKDIDYTVDGNTFYSGTGASASQIYVNIDELFPEGIEIDIDVYTELNVKSADNSLGDTLPVFNWGEDTNDNIKYLNVNGKYKLNDTDIITTNNNDIVLSDNVIVPNNFKYKTLTTGSNIDNIVEEGVFGIFNATGTLPIGYSTSDNNVFIQNMLWGDGSWGRQVLYDIRTNSTYSREKSQGSWTSWEKINSIEYSNNDIVVGKWINNKPVYRRVIHTTNLTVQPSGYSVAVGLTNPSTIIKIDLSLKDSRNDWYTFWHLTDIIYRPNRNAVEVYGDSSATFDEAYIIIEYTKTID